jgi:hypothetical protein
MEGSPQSDGRGADAAAGPRQPVIGQLEASYELAVGDRFTWRSRPVELIDLARLDRDWSQAVIRFLDDPNQPAASMPYQDLIEGLTTP